MQNYRNLFIGAIMTCLFFSGFSQNCKKFINYETKVIDSEGIGMSLPGGVGKGNLGKFNISTLQRATSEKLETLDMMQFTICQQLKNIKSTFLRDQAQVQYSNLLMKIMNLLNAENGNNSNLENMPSENYTQDKNSKIETQPQETAKSQQNEITSAPVTTPTAAPAYTPTAIPCEVNTYKSDKDYIRAFGFGESTNRGAAKDYANSDALEALAMCLEVTVKVVGQHYRLSSKKENMEEFEERLEKNTQTSISQTIRNINVVCEGAVRNPSTNNWEYYVVYEISRADAVKSVYNSLQKDAVVKETLPNHEKFKQTFDEVMKEFDKSKEISFVFEE
jgi:hypothetical protein